MVEKDLFRIGWLDVFKGVLIILMVVGHSTDMFNKYIYQFHMAAFFFASGYTLKLGNKSLVEVILNKFFTLILPVLTCTILYGIVMHVLFVTGKYNMFFLENLKYVGLTTMIKELIVNGNIYAWWLGAGWFLVISFLINIFEKLIMIMNKNKMNCLFLLESLVFIVIGYAMVTKQIRIGNLIRVLIGQFYVSAGIYFKRKNTVDVISKKTNCLIVIFLVSFFSLYVFGNKIPATVDYPSLKFNNLVWEILAAMGGTLFILTVSISISKISRLNTVFTYVGERTLPILLFHFLFFKVSFFLLFILRVVPIKSLAELIPTGEIGDKYWILFTFVSIFLSIVLWNFIQRFRIFRILFGKEKELYFRIFSVLDKKNNGKRLVTLLLALLVCKYALKGIKQNMGNIRNLIPFIKAYESGIYEDNWTEKTFSFEVLTNNEGMVSISLYYPSDEFEGKGGVVYINDVKNSYKLNGKNTVLQFHAPKNQKVKVRVENDYEYSVKNGDTRELSVVLLEAEGK